MGFYKLSSKQRNLWADKLMDLGNFAVVGLVFSQVVSGSGLSWLVAIGGLFLYISLALLATYLRR